MRLDHRGVGSRRPLLWNTICSAMILLSACVFTNAQADTTLWQCGVNDYSAAEFGEYTKSTAARIDVTQGKVEPGDWHAFPKGLRADTNPTLDLSFSLGEVPRYGSEFSFRLLHAPASGAQMAVFTNGIMCGLIQLWGTGETSSPYRWQKTYRLYIPKEMLQKGRNVLHLEAVRSLWSNPSSDSRIWWEWDYLKLAALDRPAVEPIHGTLAFLGTTLKHGEFFVNDDTLKLAQTVLPWLGIAHSGNTMRCDFWYDVASQQPRRLEYLKLLRDFNMTVCVDNISGSHFHNDVDGSLPLKIKTDLTAFFQTYGALFQYYEVGNEPCMFGGGMAETLELAHYLNHIKPANVKVTACGWAYGGGKGTPMNWDADPANRRQVELLCQATNGHSYGFSYADNRGGSFLENLQTFEGVQDGWPHEYINTETGTNDWHSEENGPRLASTQPHAQAFDRIMRAHLAVVDRTIQHAAIFDDFGLFKQPGNFSDLSSLTAFPGHKGEDSRVQTFRRLALAYATHGAPIPYVYLNRTELIGKHVYFRAVDTSTLAPLPGSGGVSDKILLNFVNFENSAQVMHVRVMLPVPGHYTADRFGPGETYADAHRKEALNAAPTLNLTVSLPARESVQYILTPPHTAPKRETEKPLAITATQGVDVRPGNSRVTIQWITEPGVRYDILRATGFNGTWLSVKQGALGGAWEDTQVTNGTTYLYTLIANHGSVKSPLSPPVGGVPQPPIGAPSRLTARAADHFIMLQWAAAPGAATYRVKRAEGASSSYVVVAFGIGGTTFSDSTAQNGVTYHYVVSGSNSKLTGADSASVTATASGTELPAPWEQVDIGTVGQLGSARYTPEGKLFTVRGSGNDIWGTADSFHFVYRTLTGDGSITAHLAASDTTDPWCKIGIVLRGSLEPGSAMAYAAITAERGTGCTFRAKEGGECEWTGGDRRSWVRLERKGQTVRAFVSADGQNWEPRGSADIVLPGKAFIGLGVCSHNNNVLNTSLFDHIMVD